MGIRLLRISNSSAKILSVLAIVACAASVSSLNLVEIERSSGMGASMEAHETAPVRSGLYSWGLEKINAPEAWETTQGDNGVIVALLDSGIDYRHSALQNNIWLNQDEIPHNGLDDDNNGYIDDIRGWDFQDNDGDSLLGSTIHYHGTFAAGLIAGANSETEIIGVAPNVRIMDLRVLDRRNRFKHREWPLLIEAIHYAIDNGARVINMSIVSNEEPPIAFHNALKRAVAHHIVLVGVTGNNAPSVLYPGKYDEVIAVSAINEDNSIASFSVDGPEVEFVAPGNDVESLMPNDQYGTSSGTSWAAAYVSGAVALLISLNPSLSPSEIRASLIKSSTDLGLAGSDTTFGHGLIDAAGLLR